MNTLTNMKGSVGVDIESCALGATDHPATVSVITNDSCERSCRHSCDVNAQCKMAVFDASNRACVHTNVNRPLTVKDAYHTVEKKQHFVTFVKSTCNSKCNSDDGGSRIVVDGKCTRWMTTDGDCEDEIQTGTCTTSSAQPFDCRACATDDDDGQYSDGEDVQCNVGEPPLHGTVGECPDILGNGKACAPYCEEGYSRRGLTKCARGTLHRATCVPNHCEMKTPTNGDVGDCPFALNHGESCVSSCSPGYQAIEQTTCYAGRLHLADCVPNACDLTELALPRDATRGNCTDSLPHGQSCEPACPDGKILSQPLVCELGTLKPTACKPKDCVVIPPTNGTLGDCPSLLAHGQSCGFACSDGFSALNTTITCNYGEADGASCNPLGCDIKPHVLNNNFDKTTTDTLMRSGTTLELGCQIGYTSRGAFRCDQGALSQIAECIPSSCSVRIPLHAKMGQCGANLNHGETCDLACTPGYELKGTTKCNAGTLTTATCAPMICPDVPVPPNASNRGDCPASMEHGTSCSPKCETGTTLTSKTKCDQGVVRLGACKPDSCDMQLPVGHAGMGSCHGTLDHGDDCSPKCLIGHVLSSATTCTKGELSVGKCEPMSCDIAQVKLPPLAILGTCPNSLRHGETCTPSCASGYTMDFPLECSFGNLTVGSCAPDGCDGPVVPAHGMTGSCRSELMHDKSCRMKCDDGYTISGDTTCSFGVVSNAQCIPNSCALAGEIKNGTMGDCPNRLSHGRTCNPECNQGFELDKPVSCQFGKRGESMCVARSCSNVTPPYNAAGKGDCSDELIDGESCSPHCEVGYTLIGKTSCTRGLLTKSECRPDDCCGIKAPSNGSLGDCSETLAHGKVCTPVCDAGYTSYPGPILCNAGALNETPVCIPKSCSISAPPTHGTMGTCKNELMHSDTCRPECKVGYTLVREMSCNAGLLTTAMCTEDGCPISAPPNGAMGACPAVLEHGEVCLPSCNPGYTLINETSCNLGVSKPSLCIPDSCQVSAPTNGELGSCSPSIEHGGTCEPECDDGYELVGVTSCLAGELTEVARCEPKTCAMKPPVDGMMGNCPPIMQDGQTCEPTCNAGFSRNIATSCAKGILEKSSCLPTNCSVSPPERGNMGECRSFMLHGESCKPGCSDGYTLAGQFTCINGRFTQSATCVPNPCSIYDESSCETGSLIRHGDSYTPVCKPGFSLSGGPLTCNAGTFHGSYECLSSSCDVTPPENGTLGTCPLNSNCDKGTGTLAHGEYCSFQCNPGYTLNGARAIGCTNGNTDGTSTCRLTSCDLREVVVENADTSVVPARIEHGESFTPTCLVGYTIDGGPFMCKAGKLDGHAQCRPDACDVSPPLNGAFGSCKSAIKHAESCMPSCSDGFVLSGGPLTCHTGQLDGEVACIPRPNVDTLTIPLTMCKIYSTCSSYSLVPDVYSYADLTRSECDAKKTELNRVNATALFTSSWMDLSQVF
jgi:hypothetical protein